MNLDTICKNILNRFKPYQKILDKKPFIRFVITTNSNTFYIYIYRLLKNFGCFKKYTLVLEVATRINNDFKAIVLYKYNSLLKKYELDLRVKEYTTEIEKVLKELEENFEYYLFTEVFK